jgi:FlaA1/EpsC-like NDP-sugar epimerase
MVWRRLDDLLARIRPHREPVSLVIDGIVVAASWHVTYLFRLGFERWNTARPAYDHWVMLFLVAVYLLALVALGVPKGMWRFSGFGEVKRLTLASLLAGLTGAVAVLMAHLYAVPRAVLALHPFVTLMGLCMVRISYRMLYEHLRSRLNGSTRGAARRALVMGAGDAGRLLIAGIQHQGWTVVGLLDDDPVKRGARVSGVPVLGTLEDLSHWSSTLDATHVVIAMPSAHGRARRRALDLAAQTRLPVLTVPSATELREGRTVSSVRDIEPEDLLGREPVALDEVGISEYLNGKTVLVTGAGGSIGSELCHQVARYGPSRLVLLELSEFALYRVEQALSEAFPHLPLLRLVGDVKDIEGLRSTFARVRPQVVFHAAAYKHVPLMEEHNAWAALRNNTLGTYVAAKVAAECGAEKFVLVSTDKAVNPTNVMGASKRAAEMALSQLAAQGHRTTFVAVRFGNVLGSSGSVIPKFKEQIARGGPVTVTHPDITRYFMTISEAARLVLQAGALGETGQVYVLDMGEPVKIVDLARDLIRLSGHLVSEIPITFTGLRPGEKLFEELLAAADSTLPTVHPRLRIALLQRNPDPAMLDELQALVPACPPATPDETVKAWLRRYVPDYHDPIEPASPALAGTGRPAAASQ